MWFIVQMNCILSSIVINSKSANGRAKNCSNFPVTKNTKHFVCVVAIGYISVYCFSVHTVSFNVYSRLHCGQKDVHSNDG